MISRQFVLFLVGVVLGLGISLMIVLIVTGLMDDVIAHTKLSAGKMLIHHYLIESSPTM